MRAVFEVALSSLWSRRGSVLLTVASLSISMVIVIGVEHIRAQAENSFIRTISNVDLLVGARTSQINLLLYSVFRIGNATNNIRWESYEDIATRSEVSWSIPLSLGDSHQGYRVLGTNLQYFEHGRYGDSQELQLSEGDPFSDVLHAVLGSEVASSLGYELGEEIVLSHGIGNTSFVNHENLPFTVSGIFGAHRHARGQDDPRQPSGNRSDSSWLANGAQVAALGLEPDDPRLEDLQPTQITAMLLGLETPMAVFGLQRAINNYPREPLTAILPAVALGELWQIIGTLEGLLSIISILVLTASLLGLSTMLLSSLRERSRELALYRAIGARPSFILLIIELEALSLTVISVFMSYLLVVAGLALTQSWLSAVKILPL